jgi:ABC-type transport system substrate-binding protein
MRALVLVALVACTPRDHGPTWQPAGNAAPRDGGTLHIATKDPISSLDPTIQYDEISTIAVHALFDTLVGYAPASVKLVPRLAARWVVSGDGLTYSFTLRDGLEYSDGSPVVAADFAYSLERARTTEDSPFGAQLTEVADVRAPAPNQLVIRLAHPNAAFINVLAMPFTTPQRKDHVMAVGREIQHTPLGTGPFLLDSWREGERIVLRKNPRYWDAANVHLDTIDWLENISRETQFLMFEHGELDTVDKLSTPDTLWLLEQPAWRPYIKHVAALNAFGSRMNVRVKPFDDRRVRQALNFAANKEHTVRLLAGDAVAAHGILPPGMPGRDDGLAPYPHDVAKARELLSAAGYPDGFDVDYVIINDEIADKLAGSLQQDLSAVGVRLHIKVMSLASFGTAIGERGGPPFSMYGWIGDYPDPSNFLDPKFHSRSISDESTTNDSFYANPELDQLLDAARADQDPATRAEMYRRAENILYEDAPWIWDYHAIATEVVQPYVRGYSPHPVWLRDFSSAWLDLDAQGRRVAVPR